MKYTQQTYINLKPAIELCEPIDPNALPRFTVRRDARIVLKYEVRKYTVFAGKTAIRGLKMALRGVEYGLSDMIVQAERQRTHRDEMAKVGVTVKYSLF